ncbi:hypothetical protein F66182_10842 [Fusarium sp. NRRL 66182]|nr:hypothetical protein F66182_10842 [Fusarium sp. NRRL 66182]
MKTKRYASALCRASLSVIVLPSLKGTRSPQGELIWSQSFYDGVWAAILYFVDAVLLIVTFWGASTGHYHKDLILTIDQRTLMWQTILLLTDLLLGAYIFSKTESWLYLDAGYWTAVTFFTMRFGEYSPKTDFGRSLLMPFAIMGIVTLGLVVNAVRSLILEHARHCMAVQIDDRQRRKTTRKVICRSHDKAFNPIHGQRGTSHTLSTNSPTTEFERRKAEFALRRRIQARSSTHRRWISMTISTFLWLIGAIVFEKTEKDYQNWSYFEVFDFCFGAWTTIGYGDLAPISNGGRSFFVFWSFLALPTMTALITHACGTVVKIIRDGTVLVGNVTVLPNDGGFVRM